MGRDPESIRPEPENSQGYREDSKDSGIVVCSLDSVKDRKPVYDEYGRPCLSGH